MVSELGKCMCMLYCEFYSSVHQLSLALADLALQSNWLTAVMDTIQTFHDSLPKVLVMLDVLKYLPEEVVPRACPVAPPTKLWV